jgi:hypothetical protein
MSLLQTGFVSRGRSDEPRCATQVADVLQSMENVTGKVTQAITGLDGPAARRPSPRRATR